ncbi:MAG TPA: P1 family peptidase, partial [Actinotalea sp.]|nr:P1 family peptidase [Actinotalea sp.]
CAEHGRGFPVSQRPGEVVPIVPAAAVFDLGRGGVFANHPDEQMGYAAAEDAGRQPEHGPVARGNVGAGTGAAIAGQRFKGGLGSASIRVHGGAVVGALAVVNAAGAPWPRTDHASDPPAWATSDPGTATTLVVVATDAALDAAETSRTATAAHDGLARALDPVHTLADGDTVFALATTRFELPSDRPARVAALIALQAAAAHAVELAVRDGVSRAESVRNGAVDLPVWPG